MGWFVKPEVVRLALSDGQYLDVKKTLNTGETQDLFAAISPFLTPGEKVQMDSKMVGIAKVAAYLVGWSAIEDGTPVPMSPDLPMAVRLSTLRNLHPDVFREIREAIDAHEAREDEASAARKNAPATENASAPRSVSAEP